MLVEGMGCESSQENQELGLKMLSLAAEQNEPNALMALRQCCQYQGDTAGVRCNRIGLSKCIRSPSLLLQALEFLKRAVAVNHAEAMYLYGQM
jgi:TPR repeat protein